MWGKMQNKISKFVSCLLVVCILMSTMPIVLASQMEDSQYGLHTKMTFQLDGFHPEYEGWLNAIWGFNNHNNKITIEIWNDGDNLEIVQIPTEDYVKNTLKGWGSSDLRFQSYEMQVHANWFKIGQKTEEIIDMYNLPYRAGKVFKPETLGGLSEYLKITGLKFLNDISWPQVGPGDFIKGAGITLDTVKAKFIDDWGNQKTYMLGPGDKIILTIKTYNEYDPNSATFSFPYEDIELDT